MSRRLPLLCLIAASWLAPPLEARAQRVQFPTAAPAFNPPPTPPPAMSSFDPYGNPLLGTPPADVPYTMSPQYGAPQMGQNVTPYGQAAPPFGQSVVPPFGQPVLPPGAPVATPGVPQSGGSLFPNGLPYQWESGTYQYQNSDGTVARLQRFMQQISYEQTWLYGRDGFDSLEINRTELSATFGIPIFYNPDTPLLITPGFAFNWFGGPVTPAPGAADLPPRVYDAYLDSAWYPQLADWFHADLGLRVGAWSDFSELSGDAFRVLGRGLGVLSFSPHFDVLVGAWYLDRNRVKLLPAGGIHWRPGELWDFYLVFPNPKIRRRSVNIGTSQWWMYVAGEYGGGSWAVERLGGVSDSVDYNDIRAIFGLEWETLNQARGHIEIAYVLDRELIFAKSGTPTLNLDDTLMVRAGIDF